MSEGDKQMALSSHALPHFIEEFRTLKLESLKKDLHKLTPEELELIKDELNLLLSPSTAGGRYE
jgi:hypothetical protein